MRRIGVLVSGLDSAVLAARYAIAGRRVTPIFIRKGFRWEGAELTGLSRFFRALPSRARVDHVAVLDLPLATFLSRHWAVNTRLAVPSYSSPDEKVYLPGRNLGLLSIAGLFCTLNRIPELAIGLLRGNPFPDSRPAFLRQVEQAIRSGTGQRVAILTPFSRKKKSEVIKLGQSFPLHLTVSCLNPRGGLHCGRCNKCRERRDGFRLARLPDQTKYSK